MGFTMETLVQLQLSLYPYSSHVTWNIFHKLNFDKVYCLFHNETNLTGSIRNVNVVSTYEFLRGTTAPGYTDTGNNHKLVNRSFLFFPYFH